VLRRLRIDNLVLIREAELEPAPGLSAITGETGAGKTILAQAIGLLLGAKGDAGFIGAGGDEAYVEAELDLPEGFLEEEGMEALAELRPEDEPGLVLARRVFTDGRTRAYAWGRSVAREDMAAAAERLIAMSGQFEQRRLARPSYQLDVLDAFVGEEQQRRRVDLRRAWRELQAARRRHDELTRNAANAEARLAELRALADDAEGLEPDTEEALRAERERLRHVTDLADAAARAAEALAPEEGEGAAGLAAQAERAVAPLERLAPELERAGNELRDVELRLRETASELRGFLDSLQAEPGRQEQVEARLERISDARRRFRCDTYEELLARAAEARDELAALEQGHDPVQAAAQALAAAEVAARSVTANLSGARSAKLDAFSAAVAEELRGVGMGDGEFRAELRERAASASGADEVTFLVRPNAGLPFAPVAETASGGELSRVALALAAVAVGGGSVPPDEAGSSRGPAESSNDDPVRASRTRSVVVFDEIDAGIGGETANAVGRTLQRLAERSQVITITHLPQIASLAERHFRVEKIPGDPTHTRIEPLAEADRPAEIERMLGGQEFLQTVRQ
jgi:DNA repair protein RecN (Recombination protein N)